MSERVVRSNDLIFEPKTEIFDQAFETRTSRIRSVGRRGIADIVSSGDGVALIDIDEESLSLVDDDATESLCAPIGPEIKVSLAGRAEIIIEMVDTFADHEYVLREIDKHRSKKVITYRGDQKWLLMDTAGMFNMLSRQETDGYFEQIDKGFDLYQSGIDLDNLSTENKKTVLELAAARQVLYLTNLRLVLSIAKPFKSPTIEDGNIGLSEAVDRFDRSKGVQFSTYATTWIYKEIMRTLSDKSRLIRIPTHIHEKYRKVAKQIDKHSKALGRDLTDEEIFDITGMNSAEIATLMQQGVYNLTSFEAKLSNETDSKTIGDIQGALDPDMERVDDTVGDSRFLHRIIEEAKLSDRQKFVLGLRTDIDLSRYNELATKHADGTMVGYEHARAKLQSLPEIRHRDIAGILGMSGSYIQTVEMTARNRLRSVARRLEYLDIRKNVV